MADYLNDGVDISRSGDSTRRTTCPCELCMERLYGENWKDVEIMMNIPVHQKEFTTSTIAEILDSVIVHGDDLEEEWVDGGWKQVPAQAIWFFPPWMTIRVRGCNIQQVYRLLDKAGMDNMKPWNVYDRNHRDSWKSLNLAPDDEWQSGYEKYEFK